MTPDLTQLLPLLKFLSGKVRIRRGDLLTRADLVSEAYLALTIDLHLYDPLKGSFLDFIVSHAMHAMLDACRRAGHTRSLICHRVGLLEEELGGLEDNDLDAAMSVRDVIAALSPADAAISRHWSDDVTAPDIAQLLGTNTAAVYYEMRKLKLHLRRRLLSTAT